MSEIRKLFNKHGGMQLIKQYAKAAVLPYALLVAPLLGFSRKGLELFRLTVQYKVQRKLYKKYKTVMENYDEEMNWENFEHRQSNKVWVCWLQGMHNAPLVVKRCFESLKRNLSNKEIIVLTAENIFDYVTFPEYIVMKWKQGIITNTHFSDILRLEVLIKHGGTWLDATVLCTGGDIPSYIMESDLFFFQVLKPGRDGHCLNMSSWLLSACTYNKILMTVQHMLYEYWKKNNSMVDYFLLHMFMEIVCDYYWDEYKKVVKFCNSIPHILLLDMFEPYDEERYNIIKEMTPFHKLAYKREQSDMQKKGTYFDVIINQGRY